MLCEIGRLCFGFLDCIFTVWFSLVALISVVSGCSRMLYSEKSTKNLRKHLSAQELVETKNRAKMRVNIGLLETQLQMNDNVA